MYMFTKLNDMRIPIRDLHSWLTSAAEGSGRAPTHGYDQQVMCVQAI